MADDPDEIPLFPLPSVVLLPKATVPLFVFEPRYRQMTEHAVARTPARIGMVAIADAHLGEIEGTPPVAAVGCEGEIVAAERKDDGTWQILLRGTRRFRIVDETLPDTDRLYRLARVETLPDVLEPEDAETLRAGRSELLELLSKLVQLAVPQHAAAFEPKRFNALADDALVNTLAQAIDLGSHEKQQLLEIDRVLERRRILCELMEFRIAELQGGTGHGTGTVQ